MGLKRVISSIKNELDSDQEDFFPAVTAMKSNKVTAMKSNKLKKEKEEERESENDSDYSTQEENSTQEDEENSTQEDEENSTQEDEEDEEFESQFKEKRIVRVLRKKALPEIEAVYESDTSDEETVNTVGNIPMEWYEDYPHIGYDINGKKILKPAKGDDLDKFLSNMDDKDAWYD
jgi:ribosome biogenesis protein ERB1